MLAANLSLAASEWQILLDQTSDEKRITVQNGIELLKGSRSCSYWDGTSVRTFEGEAYDWLVPSCPVLLAPDLEIVTTTGVIID